MTCVLCGEAITDKAQIAEIDEDGEPICVACDEETEEDEDEADAEEDDDDDYEEEAGDDEE